jgi:hypothetical protein
MDEQYRLRLIGEDDDETAIFTLLEGGEHCRIRCELKAQQRISFRLSAMFAAYWPKMASFSGNLEIR